MGTSAEKILCAVSRGKFVSVVNWQSGVLPGAVGRFCAEGQRFCLGPSGTLCSHARFWKCHSVTLSKYLYRGLLASRNSSPTVVAHHHPTFSDHTGPQHWTFTF